MKTKEQKQEDAKQKRTVLISLSQKARKVRDERVRKSETEEEAIYWSTRTVNEMLFKILYKKGEAQEFKTFWQWKEEEKTIKKGEHAYLIWGQPIKARTKKEEKPTPATTEGNPQTEDEFKYWPICYLFSNLQVV